MVPLFPGRRCTTSAPGAWSWRVIGIIYGAVLAFAQTDLKRLVAYTSVSHMGFVLLGIFAWNAARPAGRGPARSSATPSPRAPSSSSSARCRSACTPATWTRMGGLWSVVAADGRRWPVLRPRLARAARAWATSSPSSSSWPATWQVSEVGRRAGRHRARVRHRLRAVDGAARLPGRGDARLALRRPAAARDRHVRRADRGPRVRSASTRSRSSTPPACPSTVAQSQADCTATVNGTRAAGLTDGRRPPDAPAGGAGRGPPTRRPIAQTGRAAAVNAGDLITLSPLIALIAGAGGRHARRRPSRRSHVLALVLTLARPGGRPWPCSSSPPPREPRTVTPLLTMDTYALFYIGLLTRGHRRSSRCSRSATCAATTSGRRSTTCCCSRPRWAAPPWSASTHFASFFLGLELLSVSLYALIAYPLVRAQFVEAAVKYLVLAGVTSAFLALRHGARVRGRRDDDGRRCRARW